MKRLELPAPAAELWTRTRDILTSLGPEGETWTPSTAAWDSEHSFSSAARHFVDELMRGPKTAPKVRRNPPRIGG